MQPEFLKSLLVGCRAKDIHTAVDTSGYANWEVLSMISGFTDLFLYDIKHMDDAVHKNRGRIQQRVIWKT